MRLRWRPEEDPRRKRHAGASRGTRDTGELRVQVSDAPPRVAAAGASALDGCGLRVLSLRPSLAEPALPSSAGAAPPPGRCVPVSSPETSLGEAGPSLPSGGRGGPRVGRRGGLAWLGTAAGAGTWRGLSGRPEAACDSDQVGVLLSLQPLAPGGLGAPRS